MDWRGLCLPGVEVVAVMMPYYCDNYITLYQGDALTVLRQMPSESVQCVVTSPPYWGLRDYGIEGQLGLEPTIELFIEHLVEIFDEVRRVLCGDGTCWVNIGDSYMGSWGNYSGHNRGNGKQRSITTGSQVLNHAYDDLEAFRPPTANKQHGLKPKDLCLIPARLAIALQEAGWYVRSDIIWAKKSPMPESAKDRPTNAYEHIFLLSKSARYYYDAEAVKESAIKGASGSRFDIGVTGVNGKGRAQEGYRDSVGRNQRNVWHLGPEPLTGDMAGKHYAAFPTEIPRRAILAGTKPGDTVLDPFAGACTTLLVASRLGRKSIGIELSAKYAKVGIERVVGDAPLFHQRTQPPYIT